MDKESVFELIKRDNNIHKKLYLKGYFKRSLIFLFIVSSLLFLISIVHAGINQLITSNYKPNSLYLYNIIFWILSILLFIWNDSYNPLKNVRIKEDYFNPQLFLLMQLTIKEMKLNDKPTLFLKDLFELLYQYISRMRIYSSSLYVFGNKEVSEQINNLFNIFAHKSYKIFEKNKQYMIDLLELLSETYMYNIGNIGYLDRRSEIIKLIDNINSIEFEDKEDKKIKVRKLNVLNKKVVKIVLYVMGVICVIMLMGYKDSLIARLIAAVAVVSGLLKSVNEHINKGQEK